MKKGYWVIAYRAISDESAVKAYAKLAVPRFSHSVAAFEPGPRAGFTPTKPDYSSGLSLSNSTVMTLR